MVLNCFKRGESKPKLVKQDRTPLKQRFCYGVGHVFNDLCIQAWFSYLLVYFQKVALLSPTETGYIFLAAQFTDAISTPFIGYGCDKTISKFLARKYGNRKVWHLFGTMLIALSWPFIFAPCFVCSPDSPEWVAVAYYGVLGSIFSIGWPMVEISHLSLMPIVARRSKDAVDLSAIRSGLKLGSGVYVYVITWILLGQNAEEKIDPSVQKPFTYQTLFVLLTGIIFALSFHWGVEEKAPPQAIKDKRKQEGDQLLHPKDVEAMESRLQKDKEQKERQLKTWKQWFKRPSFYIMIVIYLTTQNVLNFTQSYFPLYLTDTLRFKKEAIAYFPLVILVSGILGSLVTKRLTKHFSNKILFCTSAVCVVASAVCFYFLNNDTKQVVYAPAILGGFSSSIMLVTSLTMVADFIGEDKESSGFVYSAMAFMDKASLGIIIFLMQENYPVHPGGNRCFECEEYLRLVFSLIPGIEATVAFVAVALFFRTKSKPEQKLEVVVPSEEIQGEEDVEESLEEVNWNQIARLRSSDV